MSGTWIAVLTPPLLMVPAMGMLSRLTRSVRPVDGEISRKVLHMSLGTAGLFFPLFLVDSWMVLLSACLVVGWMAAVRHIPALQLRFGGALHAIQRKSGGEFYFAAALGFLLLTSAASPVFYVVPLLILTFADAIAALAGRRFPLGRLGGPAQGKTALGCVAFVVTAFACCSITLAWLSNLQLTEIMGISLLVAMLSGITEAVSRGGSDNLTVPVAAWLTLHAAGVDSATGSAIFGQILAGVSG